MCAKKLQKLQIHDSGDEFAGPNFGATDAWILLWDFAPKDITEKLKKNQ